MKLRFLGTSAATGFPNPHCRCDNCVAAREAGWKSIRMMCSALIDDDLIIDLGPDVSGACIRQGVDLGSVKWCLQTHPHDDHMYPLHLTARAKSWGAKNAEPLEWFMSARAIELALAFSAKPFDRMDMTVNEPPGTHLLTLTTIGQWQELAFGPYRVLTIAANHDPAVEPMLFAIERDGRRLLYGTDSASLPEDTWPRVAAAGWSFDAVVFDHNDGFMREVSPTHMGSGAMLHELGIMRELGLVSDSTRVLATHIAHHSNTIHEVEDARARELGYEIAWDGLVVEV